MLRAIEDSAFMISCREFAHHRDTDNIANLSILSTTGTGLEREQQTIPENHTK
jgi:hypothetical protein